MKGEYYTFTDEDLPRYTGCDQVFGVGNVVTGQGNIRVSLVHSQKVTNHLIDNYMNSGNGSGNASGSLGSAEATAAGRAEAVEEIVRALPPLTEGQVSALEQRIRASQRRVGHNSDYDTWIASVTPADLE